MDAFFTSFGMYGIIVAYVLLGLAVLGFVGFELLGLATNIKQSKFQLLGAAALVLILGLGWVLGTDQFYYKGIEQFNLTPSTLRLIDMGIIGTYLLLLVAVLGLVADIIMSSLKR